MRVQISGKIITVPERCVCCDEKPDHEFTAVARRTTGKRVVRTESRGWNFPYCQVCAQHKQRWAAAITGMMFWVVAGLVVACVIRALPLIALPVGATCIAIGAYFCRRGLAEAAQLRKAGCASYNASVRYEGWDGSVQIFDVDSPVYALAFMRANLGKLVNVPIAMRSLVLSDAPLPAPTPQDKPQELQLSFSRSNLIALGALTLVMIALGVAIWVS